MRKNIAYLWMAILCLGVIIVAGCSSCFDRAMPKNAETVAAPNNKSTPAVSSSAVSIKRQAPKKIRPPVVAGSWYPAQKQELANYADSFFAQAEKKKLSSTPIAFISPHAGYQFSGKAAATGYELLRGKDVKRVILLGLSHQVPYRGASIAEVTHFQTPLGDIPLDHAAVARLRRCRVVVSVPEAELREHSLEIQLPLLQRVLPSFSLVPLVIGQLQENEYVELAAALAEIVDEKTVVIASSDFTHRGENYGYEVPAGSAPLAERLRSLDEGAMAQILALNRRGFLNYVEKTGATICGSRPIGVLLELVKHFPETKAQVLSHYTSGDITGDWKSTVTYYSVAFTGKWPGQSQLETARGSGEKVFPLSEQEKSTLLTLARDSLAAAVRKGSYDEKVLASRQLSASLNRKAGAFVTLKCQMGPQATCIGIGDDLRGCIGTIAPISAVAETVAQRAASAALEDSRFPRQVGIEELRFITVEVSVLTPPRAVKSAEDIVVGQHGIILSKDGQSATFLPQVAPEQGWDRATTLRHLSSKAGLSPEAWREGAQFQVYEAIVFSEGD